VSVLSRKLVHFVAKFTTIAAFALAFRPLAYSTAALGLLIVTTAIYGRGEPRAMAWRFLFLIANRPDPDQSPESGTPPSGRVYRVATWLMDRAARHRRR
jgi:hypothetical protein